MKPEKLFLLLVLVFSLFSFEIALEEVDRSQLQRELQTLEVSLQQHRRRGDPIDSIQAEIEKIRWSIQLSRSSSNPKSVTPESSSEVAGDRFSFFHNLSTLDKVIVAVGAFALLCISTLVVLLLITFVKRGAQDRKRRLKNSLPKPKNVAKRVSEPIVFSEKSKVEISPPEDSSSDPLEALEEIKSKLHILHSRYDDSEREPLSERISIFEEEGGASGNSKKEESESEELEDEPLGNDLFFSDLSQQDESPARSYNSVSDRNSQIIDAFDRGESLPNIAKAYKMGIDQINLILRISGRGTN